MNLGLFTQGMVCHNTFQTSRKAVPDDVEKDSNYFQISTGERSQWEKLNQCLNQKKCD